MAVGENFAHRLNVVIDKKGRHLENSLNLLCFYKQRPICQKVLNVCEICWVKIYIIYIHKNAFDFLLNKFKHKLFKE